MEKHSKLISYIHNICCGRDPVGCDDCHNSKKSSDEANIGEILKILRHNLNQNLLTLPPVSKTKVHSFTTLLNHKRCKDSSVNMHTIISDGYKVYNQFVSNQHDMTKLNNFRQHFAFNNYHQSIPLNKTIKTKHGHEYNVDDLVLLMLANNDHDPNDRDHLDYLFSNETEENIIIGHPGLSEELRAQYMSVKKTIESNKAALCSFMNNNPDILNTIGQFGLLFMNFNMTDDIFKMFINNFMNRIGNDVNSPLLQYEIFKTITFKSILISAANEKPSPEEFGYYLILLYFSIFDICTRAYKNPQLSLLPYFINITSKCNTPAYVGCFINKPLDPSAITPDPSSSTLKSLGTHGVFVYIPSRFPNQLVATSYNVSNDLKERFGGDQPSAVTDPVSSQHQPYHLDLNKYCKGFTELLDNSDLYSQNLSNELIKLYFSLQSDLNQ